MAKFLDNDGLQYLVERLIEIIEQKKQVDIVTTLDENSTNQQVPGALAVYELVLDMLKDVSTLHMEVVGTLPVEGESNIIYLVEKAGGGYTLHVYAGDQWRGVGDFDVDLADYWAKNELVAMTNTEIQEVIDDVMGV